MALGDFERLGYPPNGWCDHGLDGIEGSRRLKAGHDYVAHGRAVIVLAPGEREAEGEEGEDAADAQKRTPLC
jgi:hypothetical protein